MLPRIDVTITATLRPEILRLTLRSFFKNLFRDYVEAGGTLRFIINIDPVGAPKELKLGHVYGQMLDTINENTFGSQLLINNPSRANFSKAFKWTWLQIDAPFAFHLEDDWLLLKKQDLKAMISQMEMERDLASLRLSAFTSDEKRLKNWNRFFPWNGHYFECPPELIKNCGFCGHPSLIKGDFAKAAAILLRPRWNPEKQFHYWNNLLVAHCMRWRYGVWTQPSSKPIVKDIGREWLKQNNYQKVGVKAFFTEWEKTK